MRDADNYDDVGIVDTIDKCYTYHGRTDFILTESDIEALRKGKIITATVNQEYAISLRLEGKNVV